MPYIDAIRVGGIKITVTTVKILITWFCSILTKPRKVFCKNSSLSKLNSVCCRSEAISLIKILSRSFSDSSIIELFNKDETRRCLSTILSRIKIVFSCSSVIFISISSLKARSFSSFLLTTLVCRVSDSIKSASRSILDSSSKVHICEALVIWLLRNVFNFLTVSAKALRSLLRTVNNIFSFRIKDTCLAT